MAEAINIRLKADGKDAIVFKVKKTTMFKKIMDTYASNTGQALTSLRFVFDDKTIKEDDSPKMLEMEDDDQVDVCIMQIGGSNT